MNFIFMIRTFLDLKNLGLLGFSGSLLLRETSSSARAAMATKELGAVGAGAAMLRLLGKWSKDQWFWVGDMEMYDI